MSMYNNTRLVNSVNLILLFRIQCHCSGLWSDRLRQDLRHGQRLQHVRWGHDGGHSQGHPTHLQRHRGEARPGDHSQGLLPGGMPSFQRMLLIRPNIKFLFSGATFHIPLTRLVHCSQWQFSGGSCLIFEGSFLDFGGKIARSPHVIYPCSSSGLMCTLYTFIHVIYLQIDSDNYGKHSQQDFFFVGRYCLLYGPGYGLNNIEFCRSMM